MSYCAVAPGHPLHGPYHYLRGAHRPPCPVFAEIARLEPPWMRALDRRRAAAANDA